MTAPTIAAIAAVVAALIAAATLAWNVTVHRRSGRRVLVESSYAIPVYGPPHAPEFRDDDRVEVTVTNRGGAPVTVTNYGVSLGKGKETNLFVRDRPTWATPLPARVEPGGGPARLLVPVDQLRQVRRERAIPYSAMRCWVSLGDGRRVYSRNSVPLADD